MSEDVTKRRQSILEREYTEEQMHQIIDAMRQFQMSPGYRILNNEFQVGIEQGRDNLERASDPLETRFLQGKVAGIRAGWTMAQDIIDHYQRQVNPNVVDEGDPNDLLLAEAA